MSKNKDERKFEDVVQTIKCAEDDVDKVLDAARLLRHEGESRNLSAQQKADLIETGIFAAILIAFLGFFLAMFCIMR